MSSDGGESTTTQGRERRIRLYDRLPFLEEHYTRKEATAEIANWTTKQGVENYPDKSFGTFVHVIEIAEYDDLTEPQRF